MQNGAPLRTGGAPEAWDDTEVVPPNWTGAYRGTGNEKARLSRLGRLEGWMVIGELAVPIERNGICRRMSLPEERARCQAAPSFRRCSRRWGMQRRHCRKNGAATARHPYLVGTSALPRELVRQHLVKKAANIPQLRRIQSLAGSIVSSGGGFAPSIASRLSTRRRRVAWG